MTRIYELIIPKLQLQATGFMTPPRAVITLEDLIGVIAQHKGVSIEEEMKIFEKLKSSIQGISDLKINEFDEYEEVTD